MGRLMWPDKYGSPLPGQKDKYGKDFLQKIYEDVKYGDNSKPYIIGKPEDKIIFDLPKGVEKPVQKNAGYVPISQGLLDDLLKPPPGWLEYVKGTGTPVRNSLRHPDPDPVPEPEPQGKTLDELFAEDDE